MTDKNLTEIVAILDRSGSMNCLRQETITGFNSFIDEQKKATGKAILTRVQFDDQYQIDFEGVDVNSVVPLGEETYLPRGWTALNDAIGKTVIAVGERLKALPEEKRPGQVIFLIITDGLENASKEYKGLDGKKIVSDMVKHQTEKYSWSFVFMGGGDLETQKKQGIGLGVSASNAYGYSNNSLGTKAVYTNLSKGISRRRLGISQGAVYAADSSILNADEQAALVNDQDKIGQIGSPVSPVITTK